MCSSDLRKSPRSSEEAGGWIAICFVEPPPFFQGLALRVSAPMSCTKPAPGLAFFFIPENHTSFEKTWPADGEITHHRYPIVPDTITTSTHVVPVFRELLGFAGWPLIKIFFSSKRRLNWVREMRLSSG